MEWKKLNVLAKEKLNEERIMFQKHEEAMLKQSKAELTIKQQMEKEKINRALFKLRNPNFKDKKTKEFVNEQIPDINVEELFKKKSPEKKDEEIV